MTITGTDKFWNSLSTKTRNSLKRTGFINQDSQLHRYTLQELLRIPGIGPKAIEEIARNLERYCL